VVALLCGLDFLLLPTTLGQLLKMCFDLLLTHATKGSKKWQMMLTGAAYPVIFKELQYSSPINSSHH
jgi:hypothetical protein